MELTRAAGLCNAQAKGKNMSKKQRNNASPAKKNQKELRRRALLEKLPKGGRVVEIGVWRGDFSATILEILGPAHLLLVDPWHHIENPGQEDALAARVGREKMDAIYGAVEKRFLPQIEDGQIEIARDFSHNVIPALSERSVDIAILPKMALKGVIACDDYHRRGWWKNGVIRAVNEFLGDHADELRLLAIEGAQIAVQKLEPMQ
jgi:hypothetical protein